MVRDHMAVSGESGLNTEAGWLQNLTFYIYHFISFHEGTSRKAERRVSLQIPLVPD